MARATTAGATARRMQAAELELRGVSVRGIAQALKSDPRTITRDLQVVATERQRDTSLDAERYRLLGAAREVERTAWQLYASLPPLDGAGRLGALRTVLAAQQRCGDVVAALADAQIEARVSALEERLQGATGRAQEGVTPFRRGR